MRAVPGRVVLGVGVLTASLVVAGCADDATDPGAATSGNAVTVTAPEDGFHGTLVAPAPPRPDLVLPTAGGEEFDLGDRPDDEVTVLFFGYTHCPDVCPTTMADLSLAYDRLDPEIRDQVQVVFVTEDPARDTPEVLREWLDRFDPAFTGLLGGNEATAAALSELHLPETTRVPAPSTAPHDHDGGQTHEDYGIDHPGIVYAWGPGDRSVIYTGGTTAEQYAEDLTALATG